MKYHFNKKGKLKNLWLDTFYAQIEKLLENYLLSNFQLRDKHEERVKDKQENYSDSHYWSMELFMQGKIFWIVNMITQKV